MCEIRLYECRNIMFQNLRINTYQCVSREPQLSIIHNWNIFSCQHISHFFMTVFYIYVIELILLHWWWGWTIESQMAIFLYAGHHWLVCTVKSCRQSILRRRSSYFRLGKLTRPWRIKGTKWVRSVFIILILQRIWGIRLMHTVLCKMLSFKGWSNSLLTTIWISSQAARLIEMRAARGYRIISSTGAWIVPGIFDCTDQMSELVSGAFSIPVFLGGKRERND